MAKRPEITVTVRGDYLELWQVDTDHDGRPCERPVGCVWAPLSANPGLYFEASTVSVDLVSAIMHAFARWREARQLKRSDQCPECLRVGAIMRGVEGLGGTSYRRHYDCGECGKHYAWVIDAATGARVRLEASEHRCA